MDEEPNVEAAPNTPSDTPQEEPTSERQCRICLDGEDPELGRLIRPCLCKGSVCYVHVKCLHQWRNTSASRSAFYRCPQCGYHYRFARTSVVGIASNPVVVGVLSAFAFTLLLFCSSFVTTFLVSRPRDRDDAYFMVYPWEVFREIVRSAVCMLTDLPCDNTPPTPLDRARARAYKIHHPPTLLGRFVRRLLLGLPTVGAGSVFSFLWSLPFPISNWIRVRLRRGGRNTSDMTTLILLTVVVVGVARAMVKVYRLTETVVQKLLSRAEDAILEVS